MLVLLCGITCSVVLLLLLCALACVVCVLWSCCVGVDVVACVCWYFVLFRCVNVIALVCVFVNGDVVVLFRVCGVLLLCLVFVCGVLHCVCDVVVLC